MSGKSEEKETMLYFDADTTELIPSHALKRNDFPGKKKAPWLHILRYEDAEQPTDGVPHANQRGPSPEATQPKSSYEL